MIVQSTTRTNETVPMLRDGVVDSSLTIYNVTLNDGGTYSCTATTHDGETGTDDVHIQVYSKMFFLYQFTHHRTLQTLVCELLYDTIR